MVTIRLYAFRTVVCNAKLRNAAVLLFSFLPVNLRRDNAELSSLTGRKTVPDDRGQYA
ncbi:MAG: hypothetical protein HIU89_16520 [Proteobacteria bacterium]|nr:hypothetical protein [Pseudomonadota bacterium]